MTQPQVHGGSEGVGGSTVTGNWLRFANAECRPVRRLSWKCKWMSVVQTLQSAVPFCLRGKSSSFQKWHETRGEGELIFWGGARSLSCSFCRRERALSHSTIKAYASAASARHEGFLGRDRFLTSSPAVFSSAPRWERAPAVLSKGPFLKRGVRGAQVVVN